MYTKVEYIWIDDIGQFHSKSRFFYSLNNNKPIITDWYFYKNNYKLKISPIKIYKDPFERKNHYLALCDSENHNTREKAKILLKNSKYLEPLFEIEQEIVATPIFNFSNNNNTNVYCPVGSECSFGRDFLSEAIDNCLYSELIVTSKNLQDSCGKMRITIQGKYIDVSDQIMILRYIFLRTGEKYKYEINFTNCFYEFTTKSMRDNNEENLFFHDENNNNPFYTTSTLIRDIMSLAEYSPPLRTAVNPFMLKQSN